MLSFPDRGTRGLVPLLLRALALPALLLLGLLLTSPAWAAKDAADGPVATIKDVVHLSEELHQAITQLEAEAGEGAAFDLVEQVSEHFPHLRGEAYSHAHQLSSFWPFPGSGPCECAWQTVAAHNPGALGYGINIAGPDGTVGGWNGTGAKHSLTAIAGTVIIHGASQLSLQLNRTPASTPRARYPVAPARKDGAHLFPGSGEPRTLIVYDQGPPR
ncbi:hypothetical protein ACN469_30675 [Corallococcus terminator]